VGIFGADNPKTERRAKKNLGKTLTCIGRNKSGSRLWRDSYYRGRPGKKSGAPGFLQQSGCRGETSHRGRGSERSRKWAQ